MSEPDGTAPVEPMHITAALASLLVLAHDHKLPHMIGVRATKSGRHLSLEMSSLADVTLWANALGIHDIARHSSIYGDRSEIHGAWDNDWNGWQLRITASIAPPAAEVAVVEAAMLSALEVISKPGEAPLADAISAHEGRKS